MYNLVVHHQFECIDIPSYKFIIHKYLKFKKLSLVTPKCVV